MVGLRLLVPSIKVRILVPEPCEGGNTFYWPVRLAVRTPASQAGNTGSNPVRVTQPPAFAGGFFYALHVQSQSDQGRSAWEVVVL